jgi:bacillithiol synthase
MATNSVMTSIPLLDMPGNAIFHDVLRGNPNLRSFLPTTHVTTDIAAQRSKQGASRSRLVALVQQSMQGLERSSQQDAALRSLRTTDSVVAITGQQVGLYGGPLYTILKIASTVAAAHDLSASLGIDVVPMFWLEDNDHDATEASKATLPAADGTLEELQAWDGEDDRVPVWRRTLSAIERERIDRHIGLLTGPAAEQTQLRFLNAATVGRPWADIFMDTLAPYLAAWGVLVLRGSAVVRSGLHQPLLLADLDAPGALEGELRATTERLALAGYPAQATPSAYPFFVELDGHRHRPIPSANGNVLLGDTRFSHDDLRAMAAAHPERFSPNVLVRPIVQDAILPTVLTVLGPAELAYHAQLADAYGFFAVPRPSVLVRHMATIVDAKTQRLLEKSSTTAKGSMRRWADVEHDLVAAFGDDLIPALDPRPLIEPWRIAAMQIDRTLEGSVGSAEAAVTKALEQLAGKMRSALKRTNAAHIERARVIASVIYPHDTLQERLLPLLWFEARCGFDGFRSIVTAICNGDRSSHHLVNAEPLTSAMSSNTH